jgi:hypothetical protein
MRSRGGLIVISSSPMKLPEARVSKAIDTDNSWPPGRALEASLNPGEIMEPYVLRCLRTPDLNCHVQILAHPAKM